MTDHSDGPGSQQSEVTTKYKTNKTIGGIFFFIIARKAGSSLRFFDSLFIDFRKQYFTSSARYEREWMD